MALKPSFGCHVENLLLDAVKVIQKPDQLPHISGHHGSQGYHFLKAEILKNAVQFIEGNGRGVGITVLVDPLNKAKNPFFRSVMAHTSQLWPLRPL